MTCDYATAPGHFGQTDVKTRLKAIIENDKRRLDNSKDIPTQRWIVSVCDEIKELLLQKNREYGDSAINPKRIFSTSSPIEQINVRIDDKLSRLMNKGEKSISEDTEMDLIGYLILKQVAMRMGVE